jgi:hypothetical protein
MVIVQCQGKSIVSNKSVTTLTHIQQDSLTNTDSTNETPASSLYGDEPALVVQAPLTKSPFSIPRDSSPLALSSRSGVTTSSVISCGQCGTHFTGSYRRGNLARHVRNKHGQVKGSYTCRALDCLRTFRRQDARLKHERKAHPELDHLPLQPRQQPEYAPPVAQPYHDTSLVTRTNFDVKHECPQHHNTEHEDADRIMTDARNVLTIDPAPMLPLAALQTFARLHAELDADDYSHACDTLFTRWEAIAQELKDKKSVYHAFGFLVS